MGIEIQFLDWLQTLHSPIVDKMMLGITHLGDAGIFWIVLAVILLLIPKTRKSGLIVAAALCIDVIVCNGILKNLFARTRPFDVNEAVQLLITAPKDFSFPSGHTAASFAAVAALYFAGEKALEGLACACCFDCIFTNVSVCALSDRYFRRSACRAWSRSGRLLSCYHIARTNWKEEEKWLRRTVRVVCITSMMKNMITMYV